MPFAVPFASSWQPVSSAFAASPPHVRSSLTPVQQQRIRRLPCLARLRVATGFGHVCFICLRFAPAFIAVASCSALQAVTVFAPYTQYFTRRKQKHVPTFCFHIWHPPPFVPHVSRSATLAPLAGRLAGAWPVSATRYAIASLIATTRPAFLPRALFPVVSLMQNSFKKQTTQKSTTIIFSFN